MKVVLTGGTGLVGRALIARLRAEGHSALVLTRDPAAARTLWGGEVEVAALVQDPAGLAETLQGRDALVHLAGEPVVGKRWTEAVKGRLRASRIDLAEQLVQAIARCARPPATLISASAVGIYGDRGETRLTEASTPGDDFLARLCVDWEAAARGAEAHGVRVVTPRLGVVLASEGGALQEMLPLFSKGLGGRIGDGRHYMPWVHLHDLVGLLLAALTDTAWTGPYNATAPEPVDNRAFTRALASQLRRPALLPVPSLALRALFGEGVAPLLASQRALPERALQQGFRFRFDRVEAALADLLG